MNLNTTFVVSAIQAVARACCAAGAGTIRCCGVLPPPARTVVIFERLGLPLCSLARLSLPHSAAFFFREPGPLQSAATATSVGLASVRGSE